MSFLDNICQNFGLQEGMPYSFRAVMLGEVGVYLEGVKSVISFSSNSVLVRVSSGKILVEGKNLIIKKYCLGDLVIVGKISSVVKND